MILEKNNIDAKTKTLPPDWKVKTIQSIASIITGDKDTQDRKPDGKYCFYVRSQKVERIDSYSFDGEAILTSGDGVGVGKIFHYVKGKFDFHQRVYNINGFDPSVNGRYLFYQFSNRFYDRVMSMTAKSSVDSVRREMIADMEIPFPPTLREQQAIATALSDVDDLIHKLDQLIEKKRNIKKATMQLLLTGRKRLPGFSGGWEVRKLGELGTVIRGASPRPKGDPRYYGGTVPRLMVKDVTRDGKYVTPQVDFLTEEGAKRSRPCSAGTLTIVCSGTVGVPSILAVDACIHDGFLALINIDKNVSIDFLYHTLSTLQETFDQSATHGGVFTNLTTSILKEFEISIPSFEEQEAIANILTSIDDEIDSLTALMKKNASIKQGMMQQLLTGKIRLV